MAGTLTFPVTDTLKRIVKHTRKYGKCRVAYSDPKAYTEEPSLFLVKDSGVYLMSASDEALPRGDEEKANLVAYAQGLNPKTDGDIWDEQQSVCGGDDFAENVDLGIFEKAIKGGCKAIKIRLTENSMEILADIPKRR